MFGGRRFRMRSISRLQVAVLLVMGFILGYHLTPRLLSVLSSEKPGIEFTSSGKGFIVEGKEKRILSGAIHYFRVVPAYWEDRLRKLKAAGLNTVETYMPWNLHEPAPGRFDFTGILDVAHFLTLAQSLGLHAIVRPGPYICSEWELGGLPAWLLHDPDMVLRSMYFNYLQAVERYFTRVFQILRPLQSSMGGPVIAFQIENEFADYSKNYEEGKQYMMFLYKLMKRLGAKELLFTSDGQNSLENASRLRPANDVLLTVNFMHDKQGLDSLKELQPDKPLMVMEFWSGWFDHWEEPRLIRNIQPAELAEQTEAILDKGASLNYYMFHGGTNFGFMNGANWGDAMATRYNPTVTSYDYDAPVSENGSITEKYREIRKTLIKKARESLPMYPLPPIPADISSAAYGSIKLTLYIPILNILQYLPDPFESKDPVPMELLPLHTCGQSYGFTLYRSLIPSGQTKVTIYQLRDYGMAMVDYKPVQHLTYFSLQSFVYTPKDEQGSGEVVLDILVENAGRVNYGTPLDRRKGITGEVHVNDRKHENWKIYSLEFKPDFIENIDAGGMWQRTPAPPNNGPALYKGSFTLADQPKDTHIDMKGWEKGVVFINGANLGRYWSRGPQQTLYIPAPLLKRGINKIMIFEMYSHNFPETVFLRDTPILDAGIYL